MFKLMKSSTAKFANDAKPLLSTNKRLASSDYSQKTKGKGSVCIVTSQWFLSQLGTSSGYTIHGLEPTPVYCTTPMTVSNVTFLKIQQGDTGIS